MIRVGTRKIVGLSILGAGIFACGLRIGSCQSSRREFTLADDIELSQFVEGAYTGETGPISLSPNGKYFVTITERGRLKTDRVESTLRVYSLKAIQQSLDASPDNQPTALWTLTEATYKQSPIISGLRWLPDSTGFGFLLKTSSGHDQLHLADIKMRAIRALTPAGETVTAFDMRRPDSYIYTTLSPTIRERARKQKNISSIVATGRSLHDLLFAGEDESSAVFKLDDLSELWAVVDGTRFHVHDTASGKPISLYRAGQNALAISPDGHSAVAALAVGTIPAEWERLYPPPAPSSAYRIRAGKQDLSSTDGGRFVSQYVLIDLTQGKVKQLTNGPIGDTAGWWSATKAAWSPDGKTILLSNTFDTAEELLPGPATAPCVVLFDLQNEHSTCLEQLSSAENSNRYVREIGFTPDGGRITVIFQRDGSSTSHVYKRAQDRIWRRVADDEVTSRAMHLHLRKDEALNRAPVLVATDDDSGISKVIFDPNPQLRHIGLADVSVIHWSDDAGRQWNGGLYKPRSYVPGKRYPLVIQTHGFQEDQFRPSGAYTTAFAAQELAAAGIFVLQMHDCSVRVSPEEGACNVLGYESAIRMLDSSGLIDPEKVGIVGFSRTCFYVMKALTSAKLHFKAASITDGVIEGYLQYMTSLDTGANAVAHEAHAMLGGPPFGTGLVRWLAESPEFNMDKVETPLQIVALGRPSLLFMWEPYAALRYLNRPVDLILLNTNEHVLTNPRARTVSQGDSVDWFRFWLKEEEDPDPIKSNQYARWRKLRDAQADTQMQETSDINFGTTLRNSH
jgi:dipeptidyl aminopeptidase/acylaminoacyl peptidase